jgi:phage tail sheath protein FI
MPVAPTYPGVYVEELPSSVHTITGVSTAVTAFLGYFSKGPMNQAQQVFSIADVERTFGSLIPNSEAGYGLGQFFANGGAEAYVVRVAAAGQGASSPAPASYQLQDTAGHTVLNVTAASPGKWGNSIRLGVDYNTSNPGNSFNLAVTQVDTSNPPVTIATEVWRNLTLTATDPNFACAVVNAGSALINLSVPSGAATDLPAPSGTVSGDISGVDLTTLDITEDLAVAFGTGSSPPSLTSGSGVPLPRRPANLTDLAGLLQTMLQALGTPPQVPNATVTVVSGAVTAKYLQVSAVVPAPASEFEFSGALATTLKLDQASASTQPVQFALGATSATEGSDGGSPDGAGLTGDPTLKTGLHALDGIAFNLLCLPDVMNLDDDSASAVISAAETFCAPRWAFLLVDVPQGGAGQSGRDTLLGIQDWMSKPQNATLRSSYAALYFPRPQIPDPLNNYRLRSIPPSGTIAGLYAQTDGTRGVWKAPAGAAATLVNVAALNYLAPGGGQVIMTDAENGVLNPLGINCLRSLPVFGNVCWGARTLDGADQIASQWKYVPVRRLALYIEASLYQGTQWVVFEPNDEPLWAQIRLNVGSFMRGLFQQGAFQGSTPASAYFVRCDSTTTTQTDVNNGVVNIIVGFAPLLPAEFVILQIQQIAGQIPT